MRVAVVGSGISGLYAAYRLAERHEVTLYESRDRLGGHTHTVEVPEDGDVVSVDTGFIVFNQRTYPQFIGMLNELGVAYAPSDMSFSARSDRRDFEYCGSGLNGLYAQRRRLVSPRHHRMVVDILRFFTDARELAESDDAEHQTLEQFARQRGYGSGFIDDHLVPMARAVWSANDELARELPAAFIARFFKNHGFLQTQDRPQWYTVVGGSHRYVDALMARYQGTVRLADPVRWVERTSQGVRVDSEKGEAHYDQVVLACHGDQARRLVSDPTRQEQEILGAIRYQPNETVLHTDERVMPKLRRCWSSWNVHLDGNSSDGACLTYWMNRLQPLTGKRNYFVTLNHTDAIDPEQIILKQTYQHPVFDLPSEQAKARHGELLNHRGISYCGAYWRNGFHEDGLVSAQRVCSALETAKEASPIRRRRAA